MRVYWCLSVVVILIFGLSGCYRDVPAPGGIDMTNSQGGVNVIDPSYIPSLS